MHCMALEVTFFSWLFNAFILSTHPKFSLNSYCETKFALCNNLQNRQVNLHFENSFIKSEMPNKWKTKEILLYAIVFSNMKKTEDIYKIANKIVLKKIIYFCECLYLCLHLTLIN